MSCLPRHILSPAVQLVSRFGSSPLPTSRGITRHHVTYRDVPQSPRYLAPPASLPLPTRLSRDIPRHPAAPTSIAPVPSLGYPMTSQDPVVSPTAPCEIHDTTMSSGPIALSSDQPSFGSPASTASHSTPCPTAVALTVEKGPPREPALQAVAHPEGCFGSPVRPLHPSVRPFHNPLSFLAPDDHPAPVRHLPT